MGLEDFESSSFGSEPSKPEFFAHQLEMHHQAPNNFYAVVFVLFDEQAVPPQVELTTVLFNKTGVVVFPITTGIGAGVIGLVL